jgi:uncharacterized membrane protein HdeD (DUF308 family)
METKPIKAAGIVLILAGIATVVLGLWTAYSPEVFGTPTFTATENFLWWHIYGITIATMTLCVIIGAAMIIAGMLLIVAVKKDKQL